MKLVVEAIESAGYTGKVSISTDIAASEFYVTADGPNKGKYDLDFKNTENNDGSQVIDGDELISMYQEWCGKIPLASIEDPFDHAGRLRELRQDDGQDGRGCSDRRR